MKKITLITLCLSLTSIGFAQKKPLDHSVYDDWQSIKRTSISNKGNYAAYLVDPQEGDGIFYLHDLKKKRKTKIDRVSTYSITPDEKNLIALIKPKFSQAKAHRENKGKPKDAPKDTLIITTLPIQKIDTIGGVKSYNIGKEGSHFFAYQPIDTTTTKTKKDSITFKNPLVIREFGSTWCDTITYVDKYYFSKNGDKLVALTLPDKKDTIQTAKQVIFYDLTNKVKKVIASDYYKYLTPRFNEEGNMLALLASKDTVKPTNKHFELLLYKAGNEACQTLIDKEYTRNLPKNWFFTENSWVNFSHSGDKLFTSIAPLATPSDTVTYKEEKAALDLWHYQDPYVQPAQLLNKSKDEKHTYTAVIDLNNPHQLIPLTTERYESISRINRGDTHFAIATNTSKYMIESQWMGMSRRDIYKVDYTTGERKLLIEALRGYAEPSPNGKYLLIYNLEDQNWYSYNLSTDKTTNLTGHLDIAFWDESSDTPGEPFPYGDMGWMKDDQFVYLYDAFDVWQFDPEGQKEPICITKQAGRNNNLKYRVYSLDSEQRFFEPNEKLLFSVFHKKTKDMAIATMNISKPEQPKLLTKQEAITYNSVIKAKDKEDYLFIKSNFQLCPDIYYTQNLWKSSTKLSSINPQKEEYNWGTSELFHWTAFDGQKLDGLLYKPEDFDPNKKYPVMVYFYETHSDELNAHYMPQPSWSIINISFYVSRGYVVFCPDIHYTAGLPGESAYNCIVSGAQALAKNKWIDSDNMAIQGQSWGGYQVAYLVTRTNMFKAAGSGAPVSNMTSAFGGIRWSTGSSRQMQYERGQSRIGGTLWDCPELYILNSPVFRADKIETPLLIMHNDKDGAVPWYQGIEMFMAMRRLQKPVWMLQYNNEQHNLVKRVNRKDLSIRLQQFFDHYLKGAPAPEWLEKGLPAVKKGKSWGTDLIK